MKKVLLGVMPYWDPLIPPQGIANIKKYLTRNGYIVKTVDANIYDDFKNIYYKYFEFIKQNIPDENQGNFYSIGHFVLQNHLTAHFNVIHQNDYEDLVELLVYKTYYTHFSKEKIRFLIGVVNDFYKVLEVFLFDLMDEFEPDAVGLTFTTGTFPASTYALKFIKEKYPTTMTLMGGGIFADQFARQSPNYEYFIDYSKGFIDKIIIGQGELLTYKILQGEFPSGQRIFGLEDIDNEILSFEEQGVPDLSDYKLDSYPYMGATGSVSCQYQCSFCNSIKFYGKYRSKKIEQTVDEMIEINKKTNNQLFFMTDSMLNPTIEEFSKELIERKQSLYWDAYFRVDEPSSDISNTLKWRRAGFYRARLGVESGSQKILDLIGKEITVEQTKATLASLAYAGIKTTTYWVIGHPGETEEDFEQTLELLKEMKSYIWQAEPAQFDYYYDGQSNSDIWADKRILLYPEKYKDMLVSQSWILNCKPSRKTTYERIFRFTQKCKELNIPNPYSIGEIKEADERWKQLHKNSVPGILDFVKRKKPITENISIKECSIVKTDVKHIEEFSF